MTDELSEARRKRDRKRDRKQLADTVMNDLGVSAEALASLTDTAPNAVREAILDGLHRQDMYKQVGRGHAAQDEADGIPGERCCNGVCPKYKQSEFEHVDPVTFLCSYSGRRDYCTDGVDGAQGCIYRMAKQPPSDPFSRIPSHRDAINMLRRAGLVKPDDFGEYNGTDFAFHQATEKLWFAYLQALVDLKKIPEELRDQGWGTIGDHVKKELVK